MNVDEKTMVAIVQLYLSHTFLEDECIPLRVWHKQFFTAYCTLRTLCHASIKLWRLRNYRIMVPEEAILSNMRQLLAPVKGELSDFLSATGSASAGPRPERVCGPHMLMRAADACW